MVCSCSVVAVKEDVLQANTFRNMDVVCASDFLQGRVMRVVGCLTQDVH